MSSFAQKNTLLVILGPTSSGKSDLAVEIAKQFNGEVISADSRQVYRGMDIGTGKVPRDKSKIKNQKSKFQFKSQSDYFYKGIRHHLLDVASPKRQFTVAQYKKLAQKAIKDIQKRGKIPILCGGTGLYIQAVVDDLQIPAVKPNFKLRAELEKKSVGELFAILLKLDPARARNIDPKNPRRLIRAIEIVKTTGKPVPMHDKIPPRLASRAKRTNLLASLKLWRSGPLQKGGTHPPFSKEGWGGFDTLLIGIKKSPEELKELIRKRLLKRLKQGMVTEVKNLCQAGISWKRLDSFGLEYRWLAKYLQKKISRKEMILRLQKESEHYAKRQMTWFKKDQRIHWTQNKKQAFGLVKKFLD